MLMQISNKIAFFIHTTSFYKYIIKIAISTLEYLFQPHEGGLRGLVEDARVAREGVEGVVAALNDVHARVRVLAGFHRLLDVLDCHEILCADDGQQGRFHFRQLFAEIDGLDVPDPLQADVAHVVIPFFLDHAGVAVGLGFLARALGDDERERPVGAAGPGNHGLVAGFVGGRQVGVQAALAPADQADALAGHPIEAAQVLAGCEDVRASVGEVEVLLVTGAFAVAEEVDADAGNALARQHLGQTLVAAGDLVLLRAGAVQDDHGRDGVSGRGGCGLFDAGRDLMVTVGDEEGVVEGLGGHRWVP